MWYGLLLFLLLLVTLVYGLYQFLRAEVKTVEAIQATVFIIAYPVVAYLVWTHGQTPAWLTAPVVACRPGQKLHHPISIGMAAHRGVE